MMTHPPLPFPPRSREWISGAALPPPVVVCLPVGYHESARLGGLPLVAGFGDRFIVVSIEQQYNTTILGGILRHRRTIDQKAHRRGVRIMIPGGQQHWLIHGALLAKRAMRQETVVAKRPQVSIERVNPLLDGAVHHHPPTPLDAFFQQDGQYPFDRLCLEM